MKFAFRGMMAGLAAAGVVLASAGSAVAGDVQAPVPVTLTVTAACNVKAYSGGGPNSLGAHNIVFPNYDGSAPVDGEGQLNVHCTKGAPYSITLDNGVGPASDGTPQMLNAAAAGAGSPAGTLLGYTIFQDSARSIAWNGPSGQPMNVVGSGATQYFPTYGRVPAHEAYYVGDYADTVTATFTF